MNENVNRSQPFLIAFVLRPKQFSVPNFLKIATCRSNATIHGQTDRRMDELRNSENDSESIGILKD